MGSVASPEAPHAPGLSSEAVIETFAEYVVPNYVRYPACLVRGQGSEVWDAEGRRYLDLFPGWGCNLLGHSPPRVVEAVREQVGLLTHVPNTWYMAPQGEFARLLVECGFAGQAFFCNSGTEANEAAIKLARAHQAPRYKIITCEHSFHGRTFAALSATGQPKYQQGIGPILPGFVHVPYDDLDAVAAAIDDETAAIMVEPVQGEGGVRVPSPDYLSGLRSLCDEHGLLLVLDEVQTGMGRTGKWYAHQHAGVAPDIMTLAKALAGGVACGAMLAKRDVAASLKPGMHAATFGGNPLACRAGIATIETIREDHLLDRAEHIGSRFQDFFQSLAAEVGFVKEVRVLGAMIGAELDIPGSPILEDCMRRGLLVNCTQGTVIRLLPALTLSDAEIEEGCSILHAAFHAAK